MKIRAWLLIFDAFETLLESLEDTAEAVVLDQKQQLFF